MFPVSKEVNALGQDEGLGFGWKNQNIYKLGLSYDYNDKLTLRGGWNYGESPINEAREIAFNIVAPATVQHHLTLGFTYHLSPEMEISTAYVHAFRHEQFGPTYIGNVGRIEMEQDSLSVNFGLNM